MEEIRIKGTCESISPEAVKKLNLEARNFLIGDLPEHEVTIIQPISESIPVVAEIFNGYNVTY